MPFRDQTQRALQSQTFAAHQTSVLRGIGRSRSLLSQFVTLGDLLGYLHDRKRAVCERDAVLLELIAEQQSAPQGGAIGILAAAMFPALDRLYAMLIKRVARRDRDELWSRLFSSFSEVVGAYRVSDDSKRTNVGSHLKWDTFKLARSLWEADVELANLREELVAEVVPMLRKGASGYAFFDLAEPAPNHEPLDPKEEEAEASAALDRYYRHGLISRSERTLLLGVYVGGRTIEDVATRLRIGHEAAKKRLQRAAERIRIGRSRLVNHTIEEGGT